MLESSPDYALAKKYLPDGTKANGQKCPNCGQETLVYQEGCLICKNCGASRCG
jgi:ribonucleoside-diphosphate reductase alpha chain